MRTATHSDDLAAEKGRLRALFRAQRRAAFADGPAKSSADLALQANVLRFKPPGQTASIFVFLATHEETATSRLVDAYRAAGAVVLVPRLLDRTLMLAVKFTGWTDLTPGPLGILAPGCRPEYPGTIECVLVPGLAYSHAGQRLGYGGGFYDRWLAQQPAACRIGLCFEHQLLANLPHEPHDEVVDYVITENRILTTDARSVR